MTESFSGGWLMRIALAKLLLASPDLLMLDEPTNHLDVESVEWLERFLATYDGAVLLISHDRDFINGVANKVVEIERTKLVSYQGDYESFVEQRAERSAQLEATAKGQQRKVDQTQAFINRFRYKASKAKQVQSRIRSLQKLERVDAPAEKRRAMRFTFPTPQRPGRVVVDLDEIRFAYDGDPIYDGLDLAIERDQKIALVGPNGAGKSTMLKLLAGVLEPQAGERKLGHNVNLAYFAQHQIEALNDDNRVLVELSQAIPAGVQIKARDLLGRFMFSGDDVDKPVGVLSGGERTRLALAKMLVSPANVLCLDEPTNHLDMWSRDVLEDALTDYQGTIVLITHDRHLIRSVADHIIEIVDGQVTVHHGDYDAYIARREREASRAPIDERSEKKPADDAPRPTGPKTKEQKRLEAEARKRTKHLRERLARIESELDEVGAELKQMSDTLADPSVYDSGQDIKELVRVYELAKRRAEKLEKQWEEAARSLEEAETG
jgi:ATP-binding cassette subfamily F protein 3